jgi:hypothetical protein
MPRGDLERVVHAELRRLPAPAAPATLLPRVLAAVQAWTLRPWYARAWFTWPIGLQVVSLAAFVGCLGGGVVMAPSVERFVATAIAARAVGVTTGIANVLEHAAAAATAARVVWRALGAPILPYAFVVVVLMCVACAAFGTALNRVAFGRS